MTAVISPPPFLYFPNNNNTGAPAAGFLLFTYIAGTNTKQATWTDSTQAVQNPNPLPLDANGVAAGASANAVWLDPTLLYKFVWAPANDTDPPSSPIRSIDNIAGPLTISVLTQALIGLILYPRTPAEIAALVTPVNYAYAPLDPRRYNSLTNWSSVYNIINAQADTYPDWYRLDHSLHPSLTNCLIGYKGYNDSALTGTIGYRCTAVGALTLTQNFHSTTAGGSNTAVGFGALENNIEGSGNTAVGALSQNALSGTAGTDANHHNTSLGYRTLAALTSGVQNTALGFEAGNLLQTASNNTIVGDSALSNAVTLSGCCVLGQNALFSKTAGDNTVCIGQNAGFSETTAVGSIYVGYQAGFQSTTLGGNVFIGYQPAGATAEPGANSVVIGYQAGNAMNKNASAGNAELEVIIGYQAGLRLTGGSSNVILGQQAGNQATSGSEHVILGANAGQGVTTATKNVSIGSTSGVNLNGNNNTSVGYNAGSQASAQIYTNCGSFGANAVPTAANQITLGDSGIATLRCQQTTITALSDARFKKNIRPLELPDGALEELQPVIFEWIEDGMPQGVQMGFIAQALDAWQEKWNLQWMGLVDKTNPDRLEATPHKLLFPLILGFQKLSARVAALEGDDDWRKSVA